MKPASHPSALRVQSILTNSGIKSQVVEFEQSTHTSAEAAAAIGCSVAEIAKSILFRGRQSGTPIMVVASGSNRVSEKKVATLIGEKLERADTDFVRDATGYVIGGVAPVGHARPVHLLLDEDLQQFPRIWAAAGTPFSVFPLTPGELSTLTGASWANVRQD